MKTKEQKVHLYRTLISAKEDMIDNIENGWFVHTCVCDSHNTLGGILVVYEKELNGWN